MRQALIVWATLAALASASCRTTPTGPVAGLPTAASSLPRVAGIGAVDEEVACTPRITMLRSEVRNGELKIRGQYVPRSPRSRPFFDPEVPGGWTLQVFLNTDEQDTGYWQGFDFLVRGIEWDRAGQSFVVRKITLEDGYPGGWGPQTGDARFTVHPRSFEINVPLGAIGDDDGSVRFCLETYATVSCEGCRNGISQVYVEDYFGWASSGTDAPVVARDPRPTRSTLALRSGTPRTTDVDPRLAALAREAR